MSVSGTSLRTNIEELYAYLFPEELHPLAPQTLSWLSTSRRFAGFVSAAKSKIRKNFVLPKTRKASLICGSS